MPNPVNVEPVDATQQPKAEIPAQPVEQVEQVEQKPAPATNEVLELDTPLDEDVVEDVAALRRRLHEMESNFKQLTEKNVAILKALKAKDLVSDDDEGIKDIPVQKDTARQEHLENLAEVMKQNPKYEDFEKVLSEKNISRAVKQMAMAYIEENGGDKLETENAIRQGIFTKKNPFSYLYEFISKSSKPASSKFATRTPPPSINPLGSNGQQNTGIWTKDRVASLDIMELSKALDKGEIPAPVYDAYLAGQLK